VDRRFPRSLVRLAITLFIAGVAVSAYLEAGANDWLARHPISVNLISAFIRFNVEMIVGGLADTADRSRPEELRYLHVRGLLEKLYGQMMSAHRRQAAAKIRHTRRRGVDQD
jgi:hypothetical protein